MAEQELKRQRWIYIGREQETSPRGKSVLYAVFQPVNPDGSLGNKKYLDHSKSIKKHRPYVGVVYTIMAGETTADFNTLEHEGLWSDTTARAAWQVADRATDTVLRTESRKNADRADRAMLEALKPLRDIYRKTDYLTQRAIEVELLQFLHARGDH